MKESFIESEEVIRREEVIDAYKKFVEQGIMNPNDLDFNDAEVMEANELFDKWRGQEDKQIGEDEESGHQINLAKTMLYVDAGFTDPGYLDDVLGWLAQDAQNAEKQKDDPERVETREQIATAIRKIRNISR